MTNTIAPNAPMSIPARAARNPLVVPSLFRQAGTHRASGHARRQQATRVLRREIEALPPPRE